MDALRRSPAFDTAPSRELAPGDLLHIFDIDPNVLSKDAWRPRNHNCYRLGALGHGAGERKAVNGSARAARRLSGIQPIPIEDVHPETFRPG